VVTDLLTSFIVSVIIVADYVFAVFCSINCASGTVFRMHCRIAQMQNSLVDHDKNAENRVC